jgi:hypothetical protein
MENGAIMKPPHYSLSVLSSIRKINISTLSLEMNHKKMIHAEGKTECLLLIIYGLEFLKYSVLKSPGVSVTLTPPRYYKRHPARLAEASPLTPP